jgi:membrane protein
LVLPGFEGLSLYAVGRFFFREILNNKLNVRGAAVTFNFLMAIPPTLLFLFSLVPYLPVKGIQDALTSTIPLIIPNREVSGSLNELVVDFLNTERRDLLSFGILLTLFFSSNGMMGLMQSFDRVLPVYKERSGLARRWTAIKLTLMLILVVLATLTALIVQSRALNQWLLELFGNPEVVRGVSLLLIAGLIFVSISVIYTNGPSLTQRFPFVSPGSVLATFLVVVTTVVFFYLVNNFINYNKVYGSIGTLIAFMGWLFLNTMVILVGYELNVSILLGKTERERRKQPGQEGAKPVKS